MSSATTVLRYPTAVRKVVALLSIGCPALLVGALTETGRLEYVDGVGGVLLLMILSAMGYLSVNGTLELDDGGVTYRSRLGRSVRIMWNEVRDIHCSPNLTVISAGVTGARIRLYRGAPGFTLEPYDELERQLSNRTASRLQETWKNARLPRVYPYPPMSSAVIGMHAIPLGIVILFFVLSSAIEGAWLEKSTFLALGLTAACWFLVRDYRRSHKKLVLTPDGLEERNGRSVRIPWGAVASIVVREPITFGYGSIDVKGTQGQKIRIPRSIGRVGELLHVVRRHTAIPIEYDYEY